MNENINDVFNQEIVREALLEVNPETDDTLVDKMWKLCEGNPWNAVPLYEIMKMAGKI